MFNHAREGFLLLVRANLGPGGGSSAHGLVLELQARLGGIQETMSATVLSCRIGPPTGWDRTREIPFRASSGQVALQWDGSLSTHLNVDLQGFAHPPAVSLEGSEGSKDFVQMPPIPRRLALDLELRLPSSDTFLPSISGLVTLFAGAEATWGAAVQLQTSVTSGTVQLFPQRLPGTDLAGRRTEPFLEILPLLVSQSASDKFISPARFVRGVKGLWESDAGIVIVEHPVQRFLIDRPMSDALAEGTVDPLIQLIGSTFRGGSAVPIALVLPEFSPGGALTTEHGWERALVLIRDRCVGNDATLLAHEIGHVLCGDDARQNGTSTDTYWTGELGYIMDAYDDCATEPPNQLCDTSRTRAPGFAPTRVAP